MKKNIITLILLTVWFIAPLGAQSYNTVAGMRLGTDWGVSLKQRIAKKTTLEAIVQSSLQREETAVSLLAKQHHPLLMRRLNFFTGAGIHKGWSSASTTLDPETAVANEDPFGVSMIAGIEFTIGRVNLTYDYKPAINISGGDKGFYSQTGVSMRYVLVKKKNAQKRKRQRQRAKRKKQKQKEKARNGNTGDGWKIWKKL